MSRLGVYLRQLAHVIHSPRDLNSCASHRSHGIGIACTSQVRFLITRSSEDFQLAPIRGIKLRPVAAFGEPTFEAFLVFCQKTMTMSFHGRPLS